MAKQTWKPGTLVAPVPPMLVSCGTMESPNIITAAWCGNVNSVPPKTYVSIRPERFSYHLIKENGEFVLNLPTERLIKAADWCGVRSGRDHQKFTEMGLTAEPCSLVNAPQIGECPITLECKVCQIIPMGSHDMFLADIVAVNVDDSLLDESGALHMERAGLVAYAHGQYFALGKSLGHFGFSVKKKSTARREAVKKAAARKQAPKK
ncbi:MAG: flavin reductase family protein [Oscillospiraceae bacterium]|nr:flavin reductase family protein [Oscillospiraceae bacterium]